MKKILLATAISTGLASAAIAGSAEPVVIADPVVSAPTIQDWSGAYAGIFASAASGNASLIFNTKNEDGHFWEMDHELTGNLAGARIGYDFQAGNWVIGGFAEFAAGEITGSRLNPQDESNFIGVEGNESGGPPVEFTTMIDQVSSIQARVGQVLSNGGLVYGHGGFASANVTLSGEGGPANSFDTQSGSANGTVFGIGYEQHFSDNMTYFIDYSMFNLSTSNLYLIEDGGDYKGGVNNHGRDLNVISAGVNFTFN